MSLDAESIENISISAVRSSVAMSEYLSPFISENDKEPSWDGFVYVYSESGKKKESLKGRVAVQVKGKICEDFSKSEISYSMPVSDLNNYLNDGGVILFVVYITYTGDEKKIYYSELAPIKLRKIISEATGKNSKSVKLVEFPKDNNDKVTVFLNCLNNFKWQAAYTETPCYSLDDILKSGKLINIKPIMATNEVSSIDKVFLNNDIYLCAEIKGYDKAVPLEIIPSSKATVKVIKANISVNGVKKYSEFNILTTKEGSLIKIGDSFKMKLSKDGSANVTYKNSSKLHTLAKDLDFMISYMESGSFYINQSSFQLDYGNMDTSNFDLEQQKELLLDVKKSLQVLDCLGYTGDIDLKNITLEETRNLSRLITAFVDKKPVRNLNADLPFVVKMNIQKATFALYLKPCKEVGTYEVHDFFRAKIDTFVDDGSDRKVQTSQFAFLRAEELIALDNLLPEVLLPSFQELDVNDVNIDLANNLMLELIKAYDISKGRRKEFLHVAASFVEWLENVEKEAFDKQVNKLNSLQIIKRERSFTPDETKELAKIAEDQSSAEANRVGAYLLLDAQRMAEIHLMNMSKDERENFKNFPIYRFWQS